MTDVPPTNAPTDPPNQPVTAPKTSSSWGTTILTAVSGLIGIVVGGFLTYLYGGSLETDKQRMQIQMAAYADYAKAQTALQRAGAEKDEHKKEAAENDAALKIRDAAFRIVVFSPPEVVRALAEFVEQSRNRPECNIPKTDIAVYQILRRQNLDPDYISTKRGQLIGQVPKDYRVSNEDVAMALFGCKLKQVP